MTDEQRKRVHDITYSTDDRMELAERMVALEELAQRLREHIMENCCQPSEECGEYGCYRYDEKHKCCEFDHRMRELGIEESNE